MSGLSYHRKKELDYPLSAIIRNPRVYRYDNINLRLIGDRLNLNINDLEDWMAEGCVKHHFEEFMQASPREHKSRLDLRFPLTRAVHQIFDKALGESHLIVYCRQFTPFILPKVCR
jgi:hypothetical protein